jgi:bifunctional non-homologous end joining protein LigD
MIDVSNADRVVFPEVSRTKGDVVRYYDRMGTRLLVHVAERPLSVRRYPKGLATPGFFQKNVPAHYPPSIARFEVPRSRVATKKHSRARTSASESAAAPPSEVTVYPVVGATEHFAYLANQGAIELHVPTARVTDLHRADRIVFDLDPPSGQVALVRRAAHLVREALAELGATTAPLATGSKGYHVVAAIAPSAGRDVLPVTAQKMAELLAAKHPDVLTTAYRVANRGDRVFVDWLRNLPSATVVVPFSLRARARATVATPLSWDEIDEVEPDAFTMADVAQLCDRADSVADLAKTPSDGEKLAAAVDAAFERSGLVLETFDRFRS